MQSSKIALGATFILGVVLGILLGNLISVNVAFGATTYTTALPTTVYNIDFPNSGSGLASEPIYSFVYRLPTGITFDRLQISVPISQGSYTGKPLYVLLDELDNLHTPWDCPNSNCVNGGYTSPLDLTTYSNSQPATGTVQFLFSTTTTTSLSYRDINIIFDPNSPFVDFSFNGSLNQPLSQALNGSNYSRGALVPTLKFCDGACTNNTFDTSLIGGTAPSNFDIAFTDPLPYGTTTATTGVTVGAFFFYDGDFSTTTKAEIKIYNAVTNQLEASINQIIPAGYDVNFILSSYFSLATGSKSVTASLVRASDNLNLITPADHFFNVINNSYLLTTGLESPTSLPFDLTQLDCTTFDVGCQFQKAITYLFIPSQTILDRFSSIWQELQYLKPFGYITLIFDELKGVGVSGTGAYTLPDIPFIDAIFTPIRTGLALLLWGVFAFVFYRRVKNIEI